jgi:tRNA-Thr(GGU) m(6)t(6)A37 methyltransferase TsaA
MAGCDDLEDWALRLAGAWRALLRLQLSAEAVLVLDCSAMAQKHGKSALAALCAATRAAKELSLAKVVWVAPKRLITSAAVWQPASCSAERLASARVAVVPSEGMRDVLRASLQEHTQGAVAVAACLVLPPQGAAGGLKTAVGECLCTVTGSGRACLLASAAGPPGLSKDDSARIIQAVGERQLVLEGCSAGGSGGDHDPAAVAEARLMWQGTTTLAQPPSAEVLSGTTCAHAVHAAASDGRTNAKLALGALDQKRRRQPEDTSAVRGGSSDANLQRDRSKRQKGVGGAPGGTQADTRGIKPAAQLRPGDGVDTAAAGSIVYTPIGYMQSCFKERNGTPRQGLLAPHSRASLRIRADCHPDQSLVGLDEYSHVWLLFDFHANTNSRQHAKIHPPMLDGKASGVFATRTPHRPNPIGLTLVAVDSVDVSGGVVHFRGIDVIDGTPILDIKPFVPYEALDCGIPQPLGEDSTATSRLNDAASAKSATSVPAPATVLRYPAWLTAEGRKVTPLRAVEIKDSAAMRLRQFVGKADGTNEANNPDGPVTQLYKSYDEIWSAIKEVIQLDIRRVHHRHKFASTSEASSGGSEGGVYGFCIDVLNVVFKMTALDCAMVVEVEDWSGRY